MLLPKRIVRSRKSNINIYEKFKEIDINKADELVSKCFIGKNNETVKIITSLDENNEVIHTMYVGEESKIISENFYKAHLELILSSSSYSIENIHLSRDNENNLFYRYQEKIKRNTIRRDTNSKRLLLQK